MREARKQILRRPGRSLYRSFPPGRFSRSCEHNFQNPREYRSLRPGIDRLYEVSEYDYSEIKRLKNKYNVESSKENNRVITYGELIEILGRLNISVENDYYSNKKDIKLKLGKDLLSETEISIRPEIY